MKSKIEINLNFEEIDKLPTEKYNELERQYLDFMTKLIDKAEEDYCKKKGTTKEAIMKDYSFYFKMRKAVNQRKEIKKAVENCMMFNRLLRPYINREEKHD